MTDGDEHAPAAGRRLLKAVAGLAEGKMRVRALAGRMCDLDATRAVWTLESLVRGAMLGDVTCLACYTSLFDPDPFMAAVPARLVEAWIEEGTQQGCSAAVLWLRGIGMRGLDPPVDSERLVAKELQDMTLGERRALARRADRDTLHALTSDPDAGVITNLLNNPRTTEAHALRVCSRRPTVSPALVAVIRANRWIQRYKVKRALVKNPHLELRYAVTLLVCLNRTDLHDVIDDETVSDDVRQAAASLLTVYNADLNLC